MDLIELKTKFPIPGIHFEMTDTGLKRIRIVTPCVTGEVYLHGAHLTDFQPQGHQPILWMSKCSYYEPGKPIRGGVPICFPWFGPHATDASLPGHGWARLAEWQLVSCGLTRDNGVVLEMAHHVGDFQLTYQIQMGSRLRLRLTAQLDCHAANPQHYEDALHTYFSVGDIRRVTIKGLETVGYVDKVGGIHRRNATGAPIVFEGETDRVYLNTRADCTLVDDELGRTIRVSKSGSLSTVVWNPWIEKSDRMSDFGDDEWERMACIETANVGENAIALQPGDMHTTEVTIGIVERLSPTLSTTVA